MSKLLVLDWVHGDDWEGCYNLGKLYAEGHHVDLLDIASRNLVKISSRRWVDLEWLNYHGSLPAKYSDIVWEGESWDKPRHDCS